MPLNSNNGQLLTIAIPTYNRAGYLDICLSHVCGQLGKDNARVELLVSDNHSDDNTEDAVSRYLSGGYPINYIRNSSNIGPDNNFIQCFKKARGKYVLIMGDDDILLDGALENILGVLEKGDYGVVFLNSYGFIDDFIAEKPMARFEGHTVYSDVTKFVSKAGYLMTFISVNVVNKSLVSGGLEFEKFSKTNLVHMGWIFSALFNSEKNVFIKKFSVAAKIYSSGGFKLCEVFALNFNRVFDIFIARGADRRNFEIINKKLLFKFFPANILRSRMKLRNFGPENYYSVLFPLYKRYVNFWIFTVPAIVLPVRVGYFLFSSAKAVRSLALMIKSVSERLFFKKFCGT